MAFSEGLLSFRKHSLSPHQSAYSLCEMPPDQLAAAAAQAMIAAGLTPDKWHDTAADPPGSGALGLRLQSGRIRINEALGVGGCSTSTDTRWRSH